VTNEEWVKDRHPSASIQTMGGGAIKLCHVVIDSGVCICLGHGATDDDAYAKARSYIEDIERRLSAE
jgi:hypothetical protein